MLLDTLLYFDASEVPKGRSVNSNLQAAIAVSVLCLGTQLYLPYLTVSGASP